MNKTEAMLFSSTYIVIHPRLVLEGVPVKFVNNHKHMGIILNNHYKWSPHINSIVNSVKSRMNILRRFKYL